MKNAGWWMRGVFWLLPAVWIGYELLLPAVHRWQADGVLRAAVNQGRDLAHLQAAIHAGGNPDAPDRDLDGNRTTILVNAARRCDTVTLRALLSAPAVDPQRRAADTGRALIAAADAGNRNALTALLEREGGAAAYTREVQDAALRAADPAGERLLRAYGARRITGPTDGFPASAPALVTAASAPSSFSSAFLGQSPQPSFGGNSSTKEVGSSSKAAGKAASSGTTDPPLATLAFGSRGR